VDEDLDDPFTYWKKKKDLKIMFMTSSMEKRKCSPLTEQVHRIFPSRRNWPNCWLSPELKGIFVSSSQGNYHGRLIFEEPSKKQDPTGGL